MSKTHERERNALQREVSFQIYNRRLDKGMSMAELAGATGVRGWRRIQQWERRDCMPGAYYLCQLADALDCTVDELLGRSGKKERRPVEMPLPIGSNFKRLRSGGTSWPESMSHYTNLQPALMARGQASPGKEATIFFNYDLFAQDVQAGDIVLEG